MISFSNIFPGIEPKDETSMEKNIDPSPSLNQGKKFSKYQNNIERNLEKKDQMLSDKEGFSEMTYKALTEKTNMVIDNNNYESQQQTINNLREEYEKTLKEYEDLSAKISQDVNRYVERVNPNNPYLNKNIRFSTGQVCYVTNQGVVKHIPSRKIWNSVNIPKDYIDINLPWLDSYSTPETMIPTNPPLISGTPMKFGQSVGSEGSNVFVNELLPPKLTTSFKGCFAVNDNNDNMEFIGSKPPPLDKATIQNGNFSQPVIDNNSYRYLTGNSVPGWYFNSAILVNNSGAWGYPRPYPNGNQCVSIQNLGSIHTIISLNAGVSYTLTLYACGRNCCMNPNEGNPINIELYTTSDELISQIANFTAPVNLWKQYSFTFKVSTSQSYKLYFKGTNRTRDRSTALQGITISGSATQSGSYSYDNCRYAAISNGYRYFGLQNVNTSSKLGYCAVSNSEPGISQYGTSRVVSKMIALWSSNTSGQPGNIATISKSGSLQVLNSSGKVVYSSQGTTKTPSNYLGCYNDCTKGRGLPTYLGAGKTYETCNSAAEAGNWSYFGLQFTQPNGTSQCFVGNDINLAKSMGIAKNCKALNGVQVGGGCSNAIYSVEPAGNYFLTLQKDGNMVIYRGTSPTDNQGKIWSTNTAGKQKSANPSVVASKGKYAQNWMSTGSTLAPGDFIGSDDGKIALVMQSDGNLVLYTYQMDTNCKKIGDKMGGGEGANAVYDIGMTAVSENIGKIAYVDENSDLYEYPSNNEIFGNTYSVSYKNLGTSGNDIPGAAFANANLESCKTACNKNPNCAGFALGVGGAYNNGCWPKTNKMYPYGGPIQTLKGLNLYIRDKIPNSPPVGVTENTSSIDTVKYSGYNNGGDLKDSYGLASLTSVQKKQLEQLKTKMNMISNEITNLTNKFQTGTISAEEQSNENVTFVNNYNTDIHTTNNKFDILAGDTTEKIEGMTIREIQNILKDSDIVVLQKNYEYLLWSILAAGTVLISMNIVKKE